MSRFRLSSSANSAIRGCRRARARVGCPARSRRRRPRSALAGNQICDGTPRLNRRNPLKYRTASSGGIPSRRERSSGWNGMPRCAVNSSGVRKVAQNWRYPRQ